MKCRKRDDTLFALKRMSNLLPKTILETQSLINNTNYIKHLKDNIFEKLMLKARKENKILSYFFHSSPSFFKN